MRIAQIAPLAEPVPPMRYGGTERVVSWLAEELVRRGHDVTLFAAGTSQTSATLVPVVERPVRRGSADYDLLAWHCLQAGLAQSHAGEFDVMHLHLDALGLAACRGTATPVLTTLHGRLDAPGTPELLAHYDDHPLVSISRSQREPVVESFDEAQAAVSSVLQNERERAVRIDSSDSRFNAWMERSFADLHLLVTNTDTGPYPYAGVPWSCTLFGRDGLITALESLWVAPEIARGVLARLAAYQATHVDEATDAEPGKILHETRSGELAATREIPFGRYYGSVDATPLFLMLLAAYAERSADLAFVRAIWPAAERALEWMDAYGDRDGDGFARVHRERARPAPSGVEGLLQRGVPCRRYAGRRTHRAVRGAGVCVRRPLRHGAPRVSAGPRGAGRPADGPRIGAATAIRGSVLV